MLIVVTGASKGIGYETVNILAQEHKVIAIARSKAIFTSENVYFIQGDISDINTIHQIKNKIEQQNNVLDILINNAGFLVNKKFFDISSEELHQMYQTNVFAPFTLTQQLLPFMSNAQKPHIINISSMGGITGTQKFPGLSAYASSKGALSILTECIAEELKEKKIFCNALALGATQTEMLEKAFPGIQAPINSKNMAEYISWFALNGHSYFNGKVLPVALTTP